jgi:small subunit ribosomal protein S16
MDTRTPRDGRVIEELGFYDPMVRDADARAVLKAERIDYWLSVGAQPSEKVNVLIRKYGTGGKRVEKNKEALERLKAARKAVGPVSPPPEPKQEPKRKEAPPAEAAPEAETATAESAEAEAAAAPEAGQ